MAEPKRITRADMEAAAERIAARAGITVDDVREQVRAGGVIANTHDCANCGNPFPASRDDAKYCGNACRLEVYRAANGSKP